ncbi:MAG: O-antigen ligase family protein [Pirellulaceae bacterium]
MAIAWFPDLASRTEGRFGSLADQDLNFRQRTSGRSELVQDGIRLFLRSPLGVGTGGFSTIRAATPGLSSFRPHHAAHAGWIKVLVENGILGFCLVGLWIGSFASTAFQRPHTTNRLLGLFVTVTVSIAFVTTEFSSPGIWLLMAGAMALFYNESTVCRKGSHTGTA